LQVKSAIVAHPASHLLRRIELFPAENDTERIEQSPAEYEAGNAL
jgi:hypothetical protein